MKRRNFILLAGAGAATLGVGYCYWGSEGPAYAEQLARPTALARLWDQATLRELGVAYRRRVPGENTEAVLVRLLAGDPEGTPPDAAALQAAVERDFAAGRTLLLQGWVLSVTEARQCALLSLAYE